MNKNILIIIVIGIITVGLIGFFVMNKNQNMNKTNLSDSTDESMMKNEEGDSTTMTKSERYVELSEGVLEKTQNTKRVLFFYANWCPTCRPADESFSANSAQIPDDTTLIRVNYNDTETDSSEKELAKKYNVTYQHTFVQIDETGEEVAKWNGGQIQEFLTNIN